MTSQREDEILVILAAFSRSQKDFKFMLLKVFRPNLIGYINLSKVFDNYMYMRRCKCTTGESKVRLVCGGTSVFL